MKLSINIFSIILIGFILNGCSNFNKMASNSSISASNHPLKSNKDLLIEKLLSTGKWRYQRQGDDCKDIAWEKSFHHNRYYKSVGSACLLDDAFSVAAETWYVKQQYLYIVNLSPNDNDDIILKYAINYMDAKKLILSSKGYKYTFLKDL